MEQPVENKSDSRQILNSSIGCVPVSAFKRKQSDIYYSQATIWRVKNRKRNSDDELLGLARAILLNPLAAREDEHDTSSTRLSTD
ncbi:hypothetical protein PoB_001098700 [Plakobranchus ocellatus]|uniref:Uncharacterized protein n=1 Tax=Plakobranchus ocellatus TaxID=259542 RepID=A0AAV3YNG6_9GAST|nr:hypothetical protein PoB_001098700 [Plakobranchus ocellatus]